MIDRNVPNTLRKVKDIHSVSMKEGNLLFKLACQCQKGVIVEIGSWKGYSTIWLAWGSLNGSKASVFAIDPYTGSAVHHEMYGKVDTFGEFKNNISEAGVSELITPVVNTSQEAVKGWNLPIGLLWIDGDHMLADKDLEMWLPHVIEGGTIALHDTTTWENPRKTAMQIYKSDNFNNVRRVGSITYANKVSNLSWTEGLEKRDALYRRYVYQAFLPTYNRCLGIAAKILGR